MMRAKMKVSSIQQYRPSEISKPLQELVQFFGVPALKYPEDGSDKDNTFAKFSPNVSLNITIANLALIGKLAVGDTFYVDFTKIE
jgi:hypothetical protein